MKINKDIKLLEAILFASGEPVSEIDLLDKITDKKNMNNYLNEIKKFYNERGINLIKTGRNFGNI